MHRFEYQGNTDYNYIVAIFCCYLISYLTIQLVNFYLYYTRNLFLEKIAYETYLMRRLLLINNNVYDNVDDGSDISDGEDSEDSEDSNESDDCDSTSTSNSNENEHNVDRQSVDTENSSEQSEQCEEDKNRLLNEQTEDLLKKKVE